jgi:pilus assembly protein CpaE
MIPLGVAIALSDQVLWDEVHQALQETPVRIAFEQAGVGDLASFLDRIERVRPDVVLIDLAQLPEDLPRVIAEVRATAPQPFVIVVHPDANPESILFAIRSGAREFLHSPVRETLFQALERLASEREKQSGVPLRGSKIVGYLSAKGGCGATSLACHAAAFLEAELHKPTLLCDLDLGSGIVRFLMHSRSRYSVLDACANVQRLDHSYWHALVSNGSGRLDVIAGPEVLPVKELPSPAQLRQVLRFTRTEYDWVILDLGHGLSPTIWAAIEELDELVLVTTPDVPALHQTKIMLRQLFERGFGRNHLKVVLNRVPKRTEVAPSEIEQMLGVSFFAVIGEDAAALYEAYAEAHLLPDGSPLRRQMNAVPAKLAAIESGASGRKKFSLFG